MILVAFAIIFIVLYLYYTINDVKKISNELKKLSTDIQKINLDIQGLNSSLNNINLATNNLIIQKQSLTPPPTSLQVLSKNNQANQVIFHHDDEDEDDDEDDATSVNTEELKKIINDTDETIPPELEDTKLKSTPENIKKDSNEEDQDDNFDNIEKIDTTLEKPDLHKLKYEDIRDLCKRKGISSKGTKDQLISKLQGL
jgi:hypothetical protein